MPTSEPLKIALCCRTQPRLDATYDLLRGIPGVNVSVVTLGGAYEAIGVLAEQKSDVLVVEADASSASDYEALTHIIAQHPSVVIVLIAADISVDMLRAALRIGLKEVVSLNGDPAELPQALDRIRRSRSHSVATGGQVMAFVSCKGGSGATFIATNLGYALAERSNKRVMLIDLNLQFGDAILYLSDRRPVSSVVDIVRDVHRVDAALLESAVVQVLPNFWVLPAPNDPTAASEIGGADVSGLLSFARSQADYVILDLGRTLDAGTVQALDMSDHIYPVLQQTLPYVRDGKRMLSLFKSLGYSEGKQRPVLSRFDRNADITQKDLEDALEAPLFAVLPNDYKVASASVNQGVPVPKLARSSAIAKSLSEFAGRIDDPISAPGQTSWIKRFLGSRG